MKTHITLLPGDWVLVRYDKCTFPGKVKVVGHDEVKVNVMVPSGSLFKWPAVEDFIFYRMEDVIRKLNPPTVKGQLSRKINFSSFLGGALGFWGCNRCMWMVLL